MGREIGDSSRMNWRKSARRKTKNGLTSLIMIKHNFLNRISLKFTVSTYYDIVNLLHSFTHQSKIDGGREIFDSAIKFNSKQGSRYVWEYCWQPPKVQQRWKIVEKLFTLQKTNRKALLNDFYFSLKRPTLMFQLRCFKCWREHKRGRQRNSW